MPARLTQLARQARHASAGPRNRGARGAIQERKRGANRTKCKDQSIHHKEPNRIHTNQRKNKNLGRRVLWPRAQDGSACSPLDCAPRRRRMPISWLRPTAAAADSQLQPTAVAPHGWEGRRRKEAERQLQPTRGTVAGLGEGRSVGGLRFDLNI
jgi:hypothetical protein